MTSTRLSLTGFIISLLSIACFAMLLLAQTNAGIGLQPMLGNLYQWLMWLGGAALLLGIANVVWLHLRRIESGRRDWGLSLALLAVLIAVLVAGLINPMGATSPLVEWFFDYVLAPGQAALFALLVFFMAAAAYRYLRIGRQGGAWMLAGALLVILLQLPLAVPLLPPNAVAAIEWFVDAPVMAALRGVLLGGGVALLVVALRMLIGKP
jgi:hypothetical protein